MGTMITRLTSARPAVVTDGDAARRTRELETLQALAQHIAEALNAREVLERSLQTLIEMGWFTCGEAFSRVGRGLDTVAVGLCRFETADACPLRPSLVLEAGEVMESGVIQRRGTWHMVPVGPGGLLALADAHDVSEPFLAAVAELVGSAIRRTSLHARLAEKEQQRSRLLRALLSAQEEERGRISRDLHDQIGQSLTALLLGLDRNIEAPAPDELRRLKELASITLGDVRRIALDLRPSVLDELGLEAALRRYARDMHERYGLDATVVVTLTGRLDHQEETVLYRVAQEALTNVIRHARARTVSVVATARRGSVQLVVEDDGVGFDPEALAPAEQIGLMGMRERLELLGGSLRIESAPGAGCSVYARVPLR
jgi:signal transduction histidine kinase